MELDTAIFQDLDSFGKERISKMAIENFFDFCLEKFQDILKWMQHSFVLNTVYVTVVCFTIYNTKKT